MNERKRPTQNTGKDCCPHRINGCSKGDFSPGQSIGTSETTMSTRLAR